MTYDPDQLDQPQTDQGVPVGDADVEADRRNASDDSGDGASSAVSDDERWTAESAVEERSDEGVPVGEADVEADRRNAAD